MCSIHNTTTHYRPREVHFPYLHVSALKELHRTRLATFNPAYSREGRRRVTEAELERVGEAGD